MLGDSMGKAVLALAASLALTACSVEEEPPKRYEIDVTSQVNPWGTPTPTPTPVPKKKFAARTEMVVYRVEGKSIGVVFESDGESAPEVRASGSPEELAAQGYLLQP